MYEIQYIDLAWLSSDELMAVARYPATPAHIRTVAIIIILNRELSE